MDPKKRVQQQAVRLDERPRLAGAHVLLDAQRFCASIGADYVLKLVQDDRLRVQRQRRVAPLVDGEEEAIEVEVQDASVAQREGVRHRSRASASRDGPRAQLSHAKVSMESEANLSKPAERQRIRHLRGTLGLPKTCADATG